MQKIAHFIERAMKAKGVELIMYLEDGLAIIPESQDPDAVLAELIYTIVWLAHCLR